jgi:hypothetical protein
MNVNLSNEESMPGMHTNYDFINQYGSNPIMIGILLSVIIGYYLVVNGPIVGETPAKSSGGVSMSFLEGSLWVLFITLLLLNGVRYFYDLDIMTSIQDIFSREPEIDIAVDNVSVVPQGPPVPEITYEKQVFHVSDNKYTYDDARAVCQAYGSKLASYDQIEKAYNHGGEWCGYGWSEDQMALYPTQKQTYNKLQKTENHKHDCGRPGINGGYIANPKVRFGANCYGYKPEITQEERKLMEINEVYSKTKEDIEFDKKVNYWKNRLSSVLVSPFNANTWSKI